MSNTLAGLSSDIIAQETLRALLPKLARLSVVATDFSSEVAQAGETVTTRIPSSVSSSTYSSGYTSTNAVTTAKSVTLGEPTYVQMEFKPKEVATIGFNRLADIFIEPASNAVVKSIFDDCFGLVTAANLPSAVPVYNAAITGFDRADVIAVAKQMTKANVSPEGRNAFISADAHAALVSDNTISQAFSIGGSEVIRSSRLGQLHGIEFFETNLLGSQTYSSGKTLHGFAATKEAFIVVSRAPAVQASTYADFAIATDQDSGFSFGVMKWFDPNTGLHKLRMEWLKGVALGNGAVIVPITADTPA